MSKASKNRACPALGKTISSGVCGSQRNTAIACPADCEFNPFSAKNEGPLHHLLVELGRQSVGEALAAMGKTPGFREELSDLLDVGRGMEWLSRIPTTLFRTRDGAGKTLAQRLLEEGRPWLKNDHRALLQAQTTMRMRLIEVRRIVDEAHLEAVDLLEPEAGPLLIADAMLGGTCVRFDRVLIRSFALAGQHRVTELACLHTVWGRRDPVEVVRRIVEHRAGVTAPDQVESWLFEQAHEAKESLEALQQVTDHDAVWFCAPLLQRAIYELNTDVDTVVHKIASSPHARTSSVLRYTKSGMLEWYEDLFATDSLGRCLGNVGLWNDGVVIMGRTDSLMRLLRQQFEDEMGDSVRLAQDESLPPVERGEDSEAFAGLLALIPTTLRVQPTLADMESLHWVLKKHWPTQLQPEQVLQGIQNFADIPCPWLDGQTPREASRDSQLRPRLLEVLKRLISDFDRFHLMAGSVGDMNGVLEELGFTELVQPPPPVRPIPTRRDDKEEEEEEDDDFADAMGWDPDGRSGRDWN